MDPTNRWSYGADLVAPGAKIPCRKLTVTADRSRSQRESWLPGEIAGEGSELWNGIEDYVHQKRKQPKSATS
jgi:hypothetical protein